MSYDRTFRLWVLFPIATAFIVLAFLYTARGSIFGGIVSLGVTFAMGIIGITLERGTPEPHAVPVDNEIPGEQSKEPAFNDKGLSGAESQRLTRGLVYSTLALTVAAVLLSACTYAGRWWAVGCAGLGTAVLFPMLSLFLVLRVPRFFEMNKHLALSLLPPTIDCPSCSVNMLLDERERTAKYFTCPGCSAEIDMR